MPRPVLVVAFGLVAVLAALLGLLAGSVTSHMAPVPTVRAVGLPAPSFADVVSRVNPAVVNITVLEGASTEDGSTVAHHLAPRAPFSRGARGAPWWWSFSCPHTGVLRARNNAP